MFAIPDAPYKYVRLAGGTRPDLVLESRDHVLFHVHSQVLASSSTNSFRGHVVAKSTLVEEDSQILSFVLDMVYRNPSSAVDYAPPFSFDKLADAVERLGVYGLYLQTLLQQTPTHPIFQALREHASTHALQLYILAGRNNVEILAVAASTQLVGLHISDLTDEHVEAMGPRYLRRLVLLQVRREEALKRILLQLPYPHPSTPDCDVLDQKALTKAWVLTTAYFAWDIRADLPPTAFDTLMSPLAGHVSCVQCKRVIYEQITKITAEWEAVKDTI